jgi:hypothetical protein
LRVLKKLLLIDENKKLICEINLSFYLFLTVAVPSKVVAILWLKWFFVYFFHFRFLFFFLTITYTYANLLSTAEILDIEGPGPTEAPLGCHRRLYTYRVSQSDSKGNGKKMNNQMTVKCILLFLHIHYQRTTMLGPCFCAVMLGSL